MSVLDDKCTEIHLQMKNEGMIHIVPRIRRISGRGCNDVSRSRYRAMNNIMYVNILRKHQIKLFLLSERKDKL